MVGPDQAVGAAAAAIAWSSKSHLSQDLPGTVGCSKTYSDFSALPFGWIAAVRDLPISPVLCAEF